MTIALSIYNPALSYQGQKKFDCGNVVINAFVHKSLKQQVAKSLSVAYVLTDTANDNSFIGFYTIAQHMVDLSLLSAMQLGSLPRKIPCTRLIMLGVDKHYQGQQLGVRLMKHSLTLTQSAAQQIGSFGMYLDADAEAVTFYQQLGFTLLEEDKVPQQPSPMFLPLSAIP